MATLIEKELFALFTGKSLNKNFQTIAYQNGEEYMICNADYINNKSLLDIFGITDRLKWMWEYSGVDLTIYLTVENGYIKAGRLYKAKEGGGGHGRCVSTVLSISQQELRVVRRILEYITK